MSQYTVIDNVTKKQTIDVIKGALFFDKEQLSYTRRYLWKTWLWENEGSSWCYSLYNFKYW